MPPRTSNRPQAKPRRSDPARIEAWIRGWARLLLWAAIALVVLVALLIGAVHHTGSAVTPCAPAQCPLGPSSP